MNIEKKDIHLDKVVKYVNVNLKDEIFSVKMVKRKGVPGTITKIYDEEGETVDMELVDKIEKALKKYDYLPITTD